MNDFDGTFNLLTPMNLRGITFRNRVGISPMCQYSAPDGVPTDWHIVHLGARAVGGAGLVMTESTAINPEGRITPYCLSLHTDDHIEEFRRLAMVIEAAGAVPGIQLSHAGRKASKSHPMAGDAPISSEQGGWPVVGPSPVAFDDGWPVPKQLTREEIATIIDEFAAAARRSVLAGFKLIEIHAAHGYLIHSFLSPISNVRDDEYGGEIRERSRLLLEVVRAVRDAVGSDCVVAVRLSCTDWHPHGWDEFDTVVLSQWLEEEGVDLIDCSTGGNISDVSIPVSPHYQERFSRAVKSQTSLATAAVGMITDPVAANQVVQSGGADFVFLGRESLRDPYWVHQACVALGEDPLKFSPSQYRLGWKRPRNVSISEVIPN